MPAYITLCMQDHHIYLGLLVNEATFYFRNRQFKVWGSCLRGGGPFFKNRGGGLICAEMLSFIFVKSKTPLCSSDFVHVLNLFVHFSGFLIRNTLEKA